MTVEIESLIIILGIIIWGAIFFALLIYLFQIISQKEKNITEALNLTFFKVEKNFTPLEGPSFLTGLTENPEFSENFYNFLHSFRENWSDSFKYGKFYLVFEMIRVDKNTELYFACQRKEKDFIFKNFSKFWPDFQIAETTPPNLFGGGEKASGFEMSLEQPFILPIMTYRFGSNLFNGIFEIFQKSRGKMALQVLIKPTSYSLRKILNKESGKKLNKTLLDMAKQKTEKLTFELNFRFLSSEDSPLGAKLNLTPLKKLLEESQNKAYNNFKIETSENLSEFIFNFVFRIFDPSSKTILNTEELATIFHL